MSLKEWQKMQSGFAAGFKASSQPQSCQHPSSLAAALVGRLSWVLKCLSRACSSQLTRNKKCPFSIDGLQWQLQKFHLSPPYIFISLQMSVEAVELLFFSNAEDKKLPQIWEGQVVGIFSMSCMAQTQSASEGAVGIPWSWRCPGLLLGVFKPSLLAVATVPRVWASLSCRYS